MDISGTDLLELIDRARDGLLDGDLQRARDLAGEAVQMARSRGSDVLLGDALEVLARAYARHDDPVPGLAAALEAAALAQAPGDGLAEARSLALAGSAYLELSEPADALVALERAIACLKGADDPTLEATILHSAGWAMKEVGRAATGRNLALRAIERASGMEHRSVRADALVSLGDIEADIAAAMPDSPERRSSSTGRRRHSMRRSSWPARPATRTSKREHSATPEGSGRYAESTRSRSRSSGVRSN